MVFLLVRRENTVCPARGVVMLSVLVCLAIVLSQGPTGHSMVTDLLKSPYMRSLTAEKTNRNDELDRNSLIGAAAANQTSKSSKSEVEPVTLREYLEQNMRSGKRGFVDYTDEKAVELDDEKAHGILEKLAANKALADANAFDVELLKMVEMKTMSEMSSSIQDTYGASEFGGNPEDVQGKVDESIHQWREEGNAKRIAGLHAGLRMFDKFLRKSKQVRKYWNGRLNSVLDRGIVMSAGRGTSLVNAFVTISVLRSVGCTLPIALFHFGDEELNDNTKWFLKRELTDVYFHNLKNNSLPEWHSNLESHLGRRELGYMIKVAAIYNAPFRNVLFMDSDAIPLQNPSKLFQSKTYKKHGNLFFNDFWQDPVDLWRRLNISEDPWHGIGPDISQISSLDREKVPYQSESGLIMINIEKYWKALEWLMFLNTQDAVYRFVLGDKDTYRLSFYLAKMHQEYFASPHPPALPLTEIEDYDKHTSYVDEMASFEGLSYEDMAGDVKRFRCLGMLQLHPENGTPLFHHRTADAKLRPRVFGQKDFQRPITHVSPPITSDQASIMNFGAPGFSIYKGGDRIVWGLTVQSSKVLSCPSRNATTCPCSPDRLDDINMRCGGMNSTYTYQHPTPIVVVELPNHHSTRRISSLEMKALEMIPFIEPR